MRVTHVHVQHVLNHWYMIYDIWYWSLEVYKQHIHACKFYWRRKSLVVLSIYIYFMIMMLFWKLYLYCWYCQVTALLYLLYHKFDWCLLFYLCVNGECCCSQRVIACFFTSCMCIWTKINSILCHANPTSTLLYVDNLSMYMYVNTRYFKIKLTLEM